MQQAREVVIQESYSYSDRSNGKTVPLFHDKCGTIVIGNEDRKAELLVRLELTLLNWQA